MATILGGMFKNILTILSHNLRDRLKLPWSSLIHHGSSSSAWVTTIAALRPAIVDIVLIVTISSGHEQTTENVFKLSINNYCVTDHAWCWFFYTVSLAQIVIWITGPCPPDRNVVKLRSKRKVLYGSSERYDAFLLYGAKGSRWKGLEMWTWKRAVPAYQPTQRRQDPRKKQPTLIRLYQFSVSYVK